MIKATIVNKFALAIYVVGESGMGGLKLCATNYIFIAIGIVPEQNMYSSILKTNIDFTVC